MLVVEATGIRDVPSGPLLRIGHDRFVAGPRASSSRAVREAVERRDAAVHPADRLPVDPAPAAARQVLRALPRDHRARIARRCSRCAARSRPTAATTRSARALAALPDDELAAGALARASSRISSAAIASASPTCTCRTSRELPRVLPGAVRRRRRARDDGRLRRRRAALRARVHDGVVPVGAQHARRWLRRLARAARAAAARGDRGRARARRPARSSSAAATSATT